MQSDGNESVPPSLFEISETSKDHYRIRFKTDLTVETAAQVLKELKRALKKRELGFLTVDLQEVDG